MSGGPMTPGGDGITREELHQRRIDFRGYRRSDGLYEIHGRVTDRKTTDFTPAGGSRVVPAQAAIHDMGVTVVFDRDMVITAVSTFMSSHPYRSCVGGGDTLQGIVGLRIGAGWNAELRKRLPTCDTCTHLREILVPLASAAIQTMTTERSRDMVQALDAAGNPAKIDTCHAYGRTRELVRNLWPDQYRPPEGERG